MEKLQKIALTALEKAHQVHEDLGIAGELSIQKNQFGDIALKADVEAENAIISVLKKEKIPVRLISEEHGIIDITKRPVFLGILDGLDGSSVYKRARGKGRYSTMFGIFKGTNPKYNDYIFSGIYEHSTKRLFYAIKNKGSFIIDKNKIKKIRCSKKIKLDKKTRIYIDNCWGINRKVFTTNLKGFNATCADSSAVHYADLVSGKADLVLECTRKKNLEIAIAYGLEKESSAVMITINGERLDQKRYLRFGQDKHIPIISAANIDLAKNLISYIQKTGVDRKCR